MAHNHGSIFASKLKKLDRASDILKVNSAGGSCSALQYNYAIQKQELDIQQKKLNAKWANAEAEFQHE